MIGRPARTLAVVASLLAGAAGLRAEAATIPVKSGESAVEALARAAPGDTLRLAAGAFPGDLVVRTPKITIEGEPGAIVQGSGQGSAITIAAPGVTVRNLTIRGSGLTLIDKNSGVFVDRRGDRALIEGDAFEDNLIAVYLDGPHDAVVRGNRIKGLERLRRSERGPAVSLWNTPGSVIADNDIRFGRDGVFSVSSSRNVVSRNTFHGLRFAVHFMYTNDSVVEGNLSAGDDVGYVMMYSDRLRLRDNVSDGDKDNGLLFNDANESRIEDNVVRGAEKCVFIYNANKNRFAGMRWRSCRLIIL